MGVQDLSANKCYPLEMPNSEHHDPRFRLDRRTGASINISNSRIFVFGGCTFDINLPADFTTDTLQVLFEERLKKEITEKNTACGSNTASASMETTTPTNTHTDTDISSLNFNNYLSSECFRLSLVNRKWTHYQISTSTTSLSKAPKPPARMFHGMAMYDNYLYIASGLNFNENNQLQVLNDVWRFDTIDKQWTQLFENGNDFITQRYDYSAIVLPNLTMFDKSIVNPGICVMGGMDQNNEPCDTVGILSLVGDKFEAISEPTFVEHVTLDDDEIGLQEKRSVKPRASSSDLFGSYCPVTNQIKLFIYKKSPDPAKYEPLIVFNEDTHGIRIPHKYDTDNDGRSDLEFPKIGTFGDNVIVTGYTKSERKLSSYVMNLKTHTWVKLQISCMHRIYTHKLSRGFVWQSHHKIAYLGASQMNDNSGSVTYFDNLLVLPLPFTNFYTKKSSPMPSAANLQKSRLNSPGPSNANTNDASSIHTSEGCKRVNSTTSGNSELSHSRNVLHPEHTGGFAGYAYHIAQQVQVNYIRNTLPPYAIAIGKNAFERNQGFSDFDMVCADGTIVSVPLTLCRRRWGVGFDELFADAYAKSYIEEKINDIVSSKGSTCDSNDSTDDRSLSRGFKHGSSGMGAVPYFRTPFQDKPDHTPTSVSTTPGGIGSQTPRRELSPAPRVQRNSISGALFPNATLKRASLSLSQSRRNSYNVPSRHNSVSTSHLPLSRRNSLSTNASPSRRGSNGQIVLSQVMSHPHHGPTHALPLPYTHSQAQSPALSGTYGGMSRRGSMLSRSSVSASASGTSSLLSSSAHSFNSLVSSSLTKARQNSPTQLSPRGSVVHPLPELSPSSTGGYNTGNNTNTTLSGSTKANEIPIDLTSGSGTGAGPGTGVGIGTLGPRSVSTSSSFAGSLNDMGRSSEEIAEETEAEVQGEMEAISQDSTSGTDVPMLFKLDQLPPQPPMPTVLPNGVEGDFGTDTVSQNKETEDGEECEGYGDIKENELQELLDDSLDNLLNGSGAPNNDNQKKFNPLKLPRVLYLPYSKNAVRAIVEFMYSGQIGANWRLFPTGIETLICSKQLNIPLLYDMILELLFVVLSIMESALKNELILFLEMNSDIVERGEIEKLYAMMDVSGTDDIDLDWHLLLEAANLYRRDSGSTISSDMKYDEVTKEGISKDINTDVGENGGGDDRSSNVPTDYDIDPLDIGTGGTPSLASGKRDNGTEDLSPTDTNFGMSALNFEDDVEGDLGRDDSSLELAVTAATLDDYGYETTDDSENGEDGPNRPNGPNGPNGALLYAFRKFKLNSGRKSGRNKNKERKVKTREWPTFKELLNEDHLLKISETIIELFIETGALINDSKLLLRSMHIRELFKAVQKLDIDRPISEPVPESTKESSMTGVNTKQDTELKRTSSPPIYTKSAVTPSLEMTQTPATSTITNTNTGNLGSKSQTQIKTQTKSKSPCVSIDPLTLSPAHSPPTAVPAVSAVSAALEPLRSVSTGGSFGSNASQHSRQLRKKKGFFSRLAKRAEG